MTSFPRSQRLSHKIAPKNRTFLAECSVCQDFSRIFSDRSIFKAILRGSKMATREQGRRSHFCHHGHLQASEGQGSWSVEPSIRQGGSSHRKPSRGCGTPQGPGPSAARGQHTSAKPHGQLALPCRLSGVAFSAV